MPVNRNLPEISRNRAGVNIKGEIPSRMLFYLMVPILLTPASSILLTPDSPYAHSLHPAPVSPLITAPPCFPFSCRPASADHLYHKFDSIVLYHHIIMQDFLFSSHYNTDKRTIMPLRHTLRRNVNHESEPIGANADRSVQKRHFKLH